MIALEQLTKTYAPSGPPAVDRVSMTVGTGEVCVLIGPSGCGKTTTLRMVNRLITPSGGRVLIGGQDTAALDSVTLRRSIGYVIQQVGLFPNMTVEDNIGVVPRLLAWSTPRIAARVEEMLQMVGLEPDEFRARFPNQLSGGQQQRVGVARALAADPPVLLMDEPFGAIDPINRAAIQDEFLQMQRKLRKTVLLVSHDIDEAVKLADRIAIFCAGRLEQVGTPDEILATPANDFVAGFVGADRALKRLRRYRVAEACTPVDARTGEVLDLVHAGHAGRIGVGHAGEPVALSLAGKAIPLDCLPMDADLRVATSELLRLGRAWLPCIDPEGRLRGVLGLADIARVAGDATPLAATGREHVATC